MAYPQVGPAGMAGMAGGPSGPPAPVGMQGPTDASGLGVPQGGVLPGAAPDAQTLSEIVKMLKGGQVGAEKFLQLLSLLAAKSLPQMGQGGPQGPQGPQGPPQGPGGPPPGMQGPGDIAGLMGG